MVRHPGLIQDGVDYGSQRLNGVVNERLFLEAVCRAPNFPPVWISIWSTWGATGAMVIGGLIISIG